MIYVFTSPLPVAVWTLFICRWRKIRQWQRAGKDLGVMGSNWREAEGEGLPVMGRCLQFKTDTRLLCSPQAQFPSAAEWTEMAVARAEVWLVLRSPACVPTRSELN